jgi:cell wall-associated NlpC family hydrolase
MIDYNKYVGVKFTPHGRTIEQGFDCFGLVRCVLNTEFGLYIPDWRAKEYNNKSISLKIHEELYDNTMKLDEPTEGCFGLFSYDGFPDHMVLYIGKGKILHTLKTDGFSCIERISSPRLVGRLNGWYRFV